MHTPLHERELMEGDIKIVSQIYPPTSNSQITNISSHVNDSSHINEVNAINTSEHRQISGIHHQSNENVSNENDNGGIQTQTHSIHNPTLPFTQKGSGVSVISPTQGDIDRAEEMVKLKHIDPKLIKMIQSFIGRGQVNNSKGKKKKPAKKPSKTKGKSKSKSSNSKGKKKSKPKAKKKAKKSKSSQKKKSKR